MYICKNLLKTRSPVAVKKDEEGEEEEEPDRD
jgi:hypothetical protein